MHAVAGIGFPQRFFRLLEDNGLKVIPHEFIDHHAFSAQDICFDDELPVLMTEKDAVKCSAYVDGRHWVVPVSAQLDERLLPLLLRKLGKQHG